MVQVVVVEELWLRIHSVALRVDLPPVAARACAANSCGKPMFSNCCISSIFSGEDACLITEQQGYFLLLYFLPNLPDPATTFDVWDRNYKAILYFSGSTIISYLNLCFALFPSKRRIIYSNLHFPLATLISKTSTCSSIPISALPRWSS